MHYCCSLKTGCSSKEEAISKTEEMLLGMGYVKDKDNVYKYYKGINCLATITIEKEE